MREYLSIFMIKEELLKKAKIEISVSEALLALWEEYLSRLNFIDNCWCDNCQDYHFHINDFMEWLREYKE